MKLFHVTAKGNLHFQLSDGRLAAVYPTTGYVRVSGSLKNFIRPEFEVRAKAKFDKAVANKNPGSIVMYQINPKREIAVYRRAFGTEKKLKCNSLSGPLELYYKTSAYQRELYPNDIIKLMDLLVAFENKNCANSLLHLNGFSGWREESRVALKKC